VGIYRVVTLFDLVREGPRALGHLLYDLMTSDHEWTISTRLPQEHVDAIVQAELLRSS
jgi:hypothetical protein